MKNKNLLYWIVTILFGGFMIFTAIPDITLEAKAVEMLSGDLGYPLYFIRFIGIAKIIGAIAILIPQFRRIKEWAYAGLFFDLFAAGVSIYATSKDIFGIVFMIAIIGVLFLSYFLWHKKLASEK